MRFNIIIGNVPYQKEIGGVRPKEIYSDFIIESMRINPDKLCLITPTRWYNGSTPNMIKVRELLLNKNTSIIVDYQKATDIFEGTQISGGISYWLWNKNREVEECTVKHIVHNKESIFKEKLNSEIFIRYAEGLSILEKAQQFGEFTINGTEGFWRTFSDIHINDKFNTVGDIKFIAKDGETTYLNIENIDYTMQDIMGKYKVITGAMTPGGGIQKSDSYTVINTPRIIEPNEVFSDYYYTLGVFNTLKEAQNFKSYVETKFFRILIQLINNTTSFNQSKFRYIPIQNYNKAWTDEELYKKYGLTEQEIQFIDTLIKPLNKAKTGKFEDFMNKPEE